MPPHPRHPLPPWADSVRIDAAWATSARRRAVAGFVAAMTLAVAGMAWSRTYLQVHWLTDVIAGALLGSGISLLVFDVAQRHQSGAARTEVARPYQTRRDGVTSQDTNRHR